MKNNMIIVLGVIIAALVAGILYYQDQASADIQIDLPEVEVHSP